MAIIKTENLKFKYALSNQNALNGIDISIEEGQFVLLCGKSGCGKSTFLRLLKKQLIPNGCVSGKIMYNNEEIVNLTDSVSACEIGFVMQNPDSQIVTDKVWHELAFGLENMGYSSDVIASKVAEVSQFFGIDSWYNQDTATLSGGQKQILNLASIMALQPKVLLLDEPTSMLDGIMASNFISALIKINEYYGVTIILVEHNLQEVYHLADKVIFLDNGKVLLEGTGQEVANNIYNLENSNQLSLSLPAPIQLYNMLNAKGECPLTIKQGKGFLTKNYNADLNDKDIILNAEEGKKEVVLSIKEGYFAYEKDGKNILNSLNLTVNKADFLCVLGGNGAGKSTMLNVICNTLKLYSGKISIFGKNIKAYKNNSLYKNALALLPQNPELLFSKDTVIQELEQMSSLMPDKDSNEKINEIISLLNIAHLLNANPYDLSGGEKQKVALAKLLMTNAKLLLLDEPTKGLDAYAKKRLADILLKLNGQGVTIIMVSHDKEFSAEYCKQCAMFFNGTIINKTDSKKFFANNMYYTTSASQMSRHMYNNAVTIKQVADKCIESGVKNGK